MKYVMMMMIFRITNHNRPKCAEHYVSIRPHASRELDSLICCIPLVVIQWAFSILCACQFWLNFFGHFLRHLAEGDFYNLFQSRVTLRLELWPPDPQSWSFYALAMWTTNSTNWHQNQLILLQSIMFTSLITAWTEGWMKGIDGRRMDRLKT